MISLPQRESIPVKVCSNHLPDFYEALKEGNLENVRRFEHTLTPSEQCVACAYILKAHNEQTREEAEQYLAREGVLNYISTDESRTAVQGKVWGAAIFYLLILAVVYLGEYALKRIFLNFSGGLFTASAVETVAIIVLSMGAFLMVEK